MLPGFFHDPSANADRNRNPGSIPLTRKGHFVRLIRAPPPGETSGSPVVDTAGKLLGYRGADTNVTERKAARRRDDPLQRQLNAHGAGELRTVGGAFVAFVTFVRLRKGRLQGGRRDGSLDAV